MTAFLEGLTAVDFGVLLNGEHFQAVQTQDEEYTQDITWRGAFGTDGPVLRQVRPSDESTISFTAVILKKGAAAGLNDAEAVKGMRDFEIQIREGTTTKTFRNCNWRRVAVRKTLNEAMLDCDISVPGFVKES